MRSGRTIGSAVHQRGVEKTWFGRDALGGVCRLAHALLRCATMFELLR